MREYRVMCSNLFATYSAGRFIASSAEEACQMARDEYRKSLVGRTMNDTGAFRFYTVSHFPYEREEDED